MAFGMFPFVIRLIRISVLREKIMSGERKSGIVLVNHLIDFVQEHPEEISRDLTSEVAVRITDKLRKLLQPDHKTLAEIEAKCWQILAEELGEGVAMAMMITGIMGIDE